MRVKAATVIFMLSLVGSLALVPAQTVATEQTNTDLPRSIGEVMKMKPLQVMHMVDTDKTGVVTKQQYMKFFEDLWDRMDPGHKGTVSKDVWMHGWAERNQ